MRDRLQKGLGGFPPLTPLPNGLPGSLGHHAARCRTSQTDGLQNACSPPKCPCKRGLLPPAKPFQDGQCEEGSQGFGGAIGVPPFPKPSWLSKLAVGQFGAPKPEAPLLGGTEAPPINPGWWIPPILSHLLPPPPSRRARAAPTFVLALPLPPRRRQNQPWARRVAGLIQPELSGPFGVAITPAHFPGPGGHLYGVGALRQHKVRCLFVLKAASVHMQSAFR